MISYFTDTEIIAGVAALVASTARLTTVTTHAEGLLREDRAALRPLERRILVVHDAPPVALSLCAALRPLGVTIDCAHTVAEARSLARKHRPRVAVLDYDLGAGQPSGVRLAAELGRGPHVVIVTAQADLDALTPLADSVDAEVMPLALDIDHPALVARVRELLALP